MFENYTASFEIDTQRIELSLWDTSGERSRSHPGNSRGDREERRLRSPAVPQPRAPRGPGGATGFRMRLLLAAFGQKSQLSLKVLLG